MTEVMTTVTNTDLTFDVPLDDDEAVEAWVDRLPRERVVEALHVATKMRKMFSQFEKMVTSRIVADGIMSSGETWTGPDGVDYFWGGDRHREVTDPAALKQALIDLSAGWGIIASRALAAAFKPMPDKVYLSELDRITKYESDEVSLTVRNFTKWVEGGPKLRPVEEEKGKK